MGYSLCKIFYLGRKLKCSKRCEKRSRATTEMSYAKSHSRNAQSLKNNRRCKVGEFCDSAWATAFAKTSVWAKN